jgi:hypothetical protein
MSSSLVLTQLINSPSDEKYEDVSTNYVACLLRIMSGFFFMSSLFHLLSISLARGEWMMMRNAVLALVAFAMTSGQSAPPLQQQSSNRHFDEFYAKFKTAVATQDKRRLQQMMASNFEFLRAADVAPADVFKALDQNNQQQWRNLELAVQRGSPVAQNYENHPARLLWCTPIQVIYNCYVVFQKDTAGRWRWKGFVMPEK